MHDKIKALLAKAENNSSEAEAAAALAMARKLALKYGSSKPTSKVQENPSEYSIKYPYYLEIAHAVTELFPLKFLINRSTKQILWIGTAVDAQHADPAFAFLLAQLELRYKQHLPKGLTKSARARFRKEFKRGESTRILMKTREIQTENALIVYEDSRQQENSQYIKGIPTRKSKQPTYTKNFHKGYEAAADIELRA